MYIADLHIHSRYARATSLDCDGPHLDLWARKKGIALLGTGDFTHPAWRRELEDQLMPAEEGLYVLKTEHQLPGGPEAAARFVISGEISSIYKKDGRVRKVHSVILLPDFDSARRLSARLEAIGNLHSDGRPILGLDCRDLLEITLEACPQAMFIPAHIWTPHFSLFGSFSGFNTIEECFGDMSGEIHALETGLSSDPPMNWRVSQLDGYTLVSNSDAHSPQKLGREGNLLDTELSYPALKQAIETGDGFGGTLEFFPEEGKYHLDGHRNCGVVLTPAETEALGGRCPVCGKKLTIGVEHRVEELADREEGFRPVKAKPFESLAPLPEVIGTCCGYSENSKKVQACYEHMIAELGPEFSILRESPLSDISQVAGPAVAEGISRLRQGWVERKAGFDGQFGAVILLTPAEIEALEGQTSLFALYSAGKKPAQKKKAGKKLQMKAAEKTLLPQSTIPNPEQQAAACAVEPVVAVIAGPGSGKTKTLADRVEFLLSQMGAKPREITAVTFTNQAAGELRDRLASKLGGRRAVSGMTIGTFHSVCWQQLGKPGLVSESEALSLVEKLLEGRGLRVTPRRFLEEVSRRKNGMEPKETAVEESLLEEYRTLLEGRLDFDDLLLQALALDPPAPKSLTHLLIDEFQDCNSLQYRLALHWAEKGKSLFVIGDPDQSIYGFRGAAGRCFQQLKEDRSDLREIRLVRNYRSTPEILQSALGLISHNPGGPRVLASEAPKGPLVRWCKGEDEFSQGIFCAKEIAAMTGGMDMLGARQREAFYAFSEIAVLCRTRRQLEALERCLRREDIPCVIGGRDDFLQEKEVLGTAAFFRFLLDFTDTGALKSCLELLWGCPAYHQETAAACCGETGQGDIEFLKGRLGDIPALQGFLQAAEEYLPWVKEKPEKLLESWAARQPKFQSLKRLASVAAFSSSLEDFLNTLLLGEEGDLRRQSGKTYASGAVYLSTLHGAKGLEFPVVFLAGVDKGTLPLESSKGQADAEEERRLFYVGMTRAREELILLSSGEPSPFMKEIPPELLEKEKIPLREKPAEQLRLF